MVYRVIISAFLIMFLISGSGFCLGQTIPLVDPEINSGAVTAFIHNKGFLQTAQLELKIMNDVQALATADSDGPPLIILSSQIPANSIRSRYSLKAVGMSDEKTTYHKLLLSQDYDKDDLNEVSTLAGLGSLQSLKQLTHRFNQKLGPSKLSEDVQLMTVPKDMDALMAVSFGLFDSCIVSETALYDFAAVSPEAYANLKVIEKSEPLNNLQIFLRNDHPNALAILQDLLNAFSSPEGKGVLTLLRLEGWLRINE